MLSLESGKEIAGQANEKVEKNAEGRETFVLHLGLSSREKG